MTSSTGASSMDDSSLRIDKSRLGPLTRLSAGAQGTVFAAPKVTMQYASSMVFKEYKPQFLHEMDVTVLELMIQYLESLQMSPGMKLLSISAWPCRLVEES